MPQQSFLTHQGLKLCTLIFSPLRSAVCSGDGAKSSYFKLQHFTPFLNFTSLQPLLWKSCRTKQFLGSYTLAPMWAIAPSSPNFWDPTLFEFLGLQKHLREHLKSGHDFLIRCLLDIVHVCSSHNLLEVNFHYPETCPPSSPAD